MQKRNNLWKWNFYLLTQKSRFNFNRMHVCVRVRNSLSLLRANINADSHFSPDWFRYVYLFRQFVQCVRPLLLLRFYINYILSLWKIYIFNSFVSSLCNSQQQQHITSAICDKNPKKDRMVWKENVIANVAKHTEILKMTLQKYRCEHTERAVSVLFGRSVVADFFFFFLCFVGLFFLVSKCVRDCDIYCSVY